MKSYLRVTIVIVSAAVIARLVLAACWQRIYFPVPCQNVVAYDCPDGCTKTSGAGISDCVNVTGGCCQWLYHTFTCSGGECSGCEPQTEPDEYTDYKAGYFCCLFAPGSQHHTCKPNPCNGSGG